MEYLWIPVMAGLNRLRGSEIKFPVRKVYIIALALFLLVWLFYGPTAGIAIGLSFALWGLFGWGSYMDMGTMDHRLPQPEKEDPLVDLLISPMKGGVLRDFAGMALVTWRWLPFTIFFYHWLSFIVWPVLAILVAGSYWMSIRFTRQIYVAETLAGGLLGALILGAL